MRGAQGERRDLAEVRRPPQECLLLCQRPLTDHELITPAHRCSLANNGICGLTRTHCNEYGVGTYTAEGITKLCEGLKGSAVTSLECAATP